MTCNKNDNVSKFFLSNLSPIIAIPALPNKSPTATDPAARAANLIEIPKFINASKWNRLVELTS